MPRACSSGNIAVSRDHSARVRSVGPARNAVSPVYGVTLAWMKSRTSIRSVQRPAVKPCHGLAGMLAVPVRGDAVVALTISPSSHWRPDGARTTVRAHDARRLFLFSSRTYRGTQSMITGASTVEHV